MTVARRMDRRFLPMVDLPELQKKGRQRNFQSLIYSSNCPTSDHIHIRGKARRRFHPMCNLCMRNYKSTEGRLRTPASILHTGRLWDTRPLELVQALEFYWV